MTCVRPLATIEPTAIAFGLPVHAGIGVSDRGGLAQASTQPAYQNAFVLVAWSTRSPRRRPRISSPTMAGILDAVAELAGR